MRNLVGVFYQCYLSAIDIVIVILLLLLYGTGRMLW